MSHLNEGPYKRIQNAKTSAVVNKNKEKVVNYSNTMQENLVPGGWFKIYAHTANVARFCGLQKIHKRLVPLRPVVNWVRSPTHEQARSLARILNY